MDFNEFRNRLEADVGKIISDAYPGSTAVPREVDKLQGRLKERAASGDPEAIEKLNEQRRKKREAANAAYHKLIEEAQTDPEAAEELAKKRRKSVDATTRYKDNLKEQAAAGDEQAIAKLEAQRQYNREYCAQWRSKQEDFIEEEEAIA